MITIQFLEKPSNRRLLLSWREPAKCNYTEQLWVLGKARSASVCAWSGEQIRRGDYIYRPDGKPVNFANLILANRVKFP